MNKELYDEAIRSNILSRKLIEQLMESMNYSSISFINWTVEVLKIIKTRLERGDKITDEVSGITYDIKSFRICKHQIFLPILQVRSLMLLIRQRKYIFLWKPPKTDIPTIWLWQVLQRIKHINGFPVSANAFH